MMSPFSGSVLMVGAGHMGGAMLRRWLDAGLLAEQVTVVSPSGRAMPPGVRVETEWPLDQLEFDAIILGFKPQQLDDVCAEPVVAYTPKLLISILAGVEVSTLRRYFCAEMVVRAMPNLPVAIGRGVTALFSGEQNRLLEDQTTALMAPLGLVEWIDDEPLFDVVTALSGCGPAFTFRFVDALARAGESLGLPADQAARLALATVAGSADLAARGDLSPAMLADRVASPGGSTRAGLNVLDQDDALADLLDRTLRASRDRNVEMAAAARDTSGN